MSDKWYITWEDVQKFCKTVATRYEKDQISGVYGIPRGGLILASILSYKMNVPMLMGPHRNCIIVDDISDSGETLLHYSRNSSDGGKDKGYHIVTMFYKEGSMVLPEFFVFNKTDKWIVYPWEE